MYRIAVAAVLLTTPASAAIYDVTMTRYGQSSFAPGWVETDPTGDVIDAYLEVDGTIYDTPHNALVGDLQGTTYLYDFIATDPVGTTPTIVLQFDISGSAPFNLRWSFSNCVNPAPCGGGTFEGTYRIEKRADTVVPLPAAGWLLPGALGLLALRRRRRG